MKRMHRMDVLTAEWPRLAGAQIAREAVPVAFTGSEAGNQLVIRALSWSWKRELGSLSKYLVERINKAKLPDVPTLAGVTVLNPDARLVSARPPSGGKAS